MSSPGRRARRGIRGLRCLTVPARPEREGPGFTVHDTECRLPSSRESFDVEHRHRFPTDDG